MRKYIFFLLTICFVRAEAQLPVQADTPYFRQQERAAISQLYRNATFLLAKETPAKTGLLEFAYKNSRGGYHKAQEPYSSRIASIYTEGIATTDRIKVAGSLLINKGWDDSLANNLGGHYDDPTPYFYFAGKAGKFERQNYVFKAVAAFELSRQWYLGLGLDYNYHWSTGSVDPRPDVKEFSFIVKPELIYKTGDHAFGIETQIGRGNENSDITFKNKQYSLSMEYPDRMYYLNYGYGYISMRDQSIYQRIRRFYGIGINHTWEGDHSRLYSSIGYKVRKDRNTKERYAQSELSLHSRWQLEQFTGHLFWNKETSGIQQQAHLNASYQTGSDWDSLFNATNYTYQCRQASASYSIRLRERRTITPEWGINLLYTSFRKEDLLQAHLIDYTTLQVELTGTIYKKLKNKDNWSATVAPGIGIPLQTLLTVPSTQENIFTRTVVYPDFYYWSSQVLRTRMQIQYVARRILRQNPVGLFAQLEYQRQLSTDKTIYNSARNPGQDRFITRMGFCIYL